MFGDLSNLLKTSPFFTESYPIRRFDWSKSQAEFLQPKKKNNNHLTFREYVAQANPRYQWYRHCEIIADVAERVITGELKRVMLFVPPRHGKSETISRLFSGYYLMRHPDRYVGLSSYSAELAYVLSRAAQEHYLRAGGVVSTGASAVKHWETGTGGGLWAAGVGGPITGKGGHLLLIDDPLKNAEEAGSELVREKQKEWYRSTFYTRAEPDAAIIVIQTRWHQDDLSGWLLSEESVEEDAQPERWHIVNLPAIAEASPKFPATCTTEPDWRMPGEALCPERYPVEKLRKIEKRVSEYYWSALYQQRPHPKAGLYFKDEWFQRVGAVPANCQRIRYWDKAGADQGKGDWTVGVLMARDDNGFYYVEDVVRGQWTAFPRNQKIIATAENDRAKYGRVQICIEQPPGLAKESTDTIIRQLAGFPVRPDPVHRDKAERAEPFKDQCEAGNVKLVRGDWNPTYLAELTSFPTGKHDDQVDASSGAFNQLATMKLLPNVAPAGATKPSTWKI